jgi:ankyrin repeat protein
MSIQFELPSGKVVANHTFGPNTTLKEMYIWIWSKLQDKHMYKVRLFDDYDFSKPLLACSTQLPKDVKTILVVKTMHPCVEELSQKLDQYPTCIVTYAEKGNSAAIGVLLDLKADPNIRRNHGWTPLHWASVGNHVEVTTLLLEAKANPHVRTKYGSTPLNLALNNHHTKVAAVLKQAIEPCKKMIFVNIISK